MGLKWFLNTLLLVVLQPLSFAQTDQDGYIHLTFNQEIYAIGDTAYFRMDYLNNDLKPKSGKHYMNVRLSNSSNIILEQLKVLVDNGVGSGQIPIVEQSPVNDYQIVAYADYSGTRIFKKTLHVLDVNRQQVISGGRMKIGMTKKPLVSNMEGSIQMQKSEFTPRDQVKVNVVLSDKNNQPIIGNVSVVVLNEMAQAQDTAGLEYVPTHAVKDMIALNQLTDSSTEHSTLPAGLYLKRGRAVYTSTNKPLPKGAKILFYLHRTQLMKLAQLDSNGDFTLDVPKLNGNDALCFVAEDINGREIDNFKIDWYPSRVISTVIEDQSVVQETDLAYTTYTRNQRLIDQSFDAFQNEGVADLEKTNALTLFEERYLMADLSYDMTDYRVFPTMRESLVEIIPAIDIITKKGKDIIRIDNLKPSTASSTPLYIIDGVATKDTEYFMSLKPADLRQIKIFRHRIRLKRLGFMGRNGIIYVQTKTGNQGPPISPADHIYGLSKSLEIYQRNASNSAIPNFRSTIYWNPILDIGLDGTANFTFKTTDDIGRFVIEVKGWTDDGRPTYIRKAYTVQSKEVE